LNWQTEDEDQKGKADEELHQRLINRFVENNKDKSAEIKTAISSGDIKLAHRLAHTLKSNAAQLRKADLQHAAEEVENCLKDGENHVTSSQMEMLCAQLEAVLTELLPFVSEQQPNPESELIDYKSALAILDKLEPIIRDSNPECLTYCNDLLLVRGSENLINQIENFEFKAALETLVKLRKEWRHELD